MRYFMTMLTVLGLDLGTKKWVEKSLPLGGRKVIVKNHLYLRHIKNRGMAYNTFSGKRKAILLSTAGLLSFYAALFAQAAFGSGNRKLAMPLGVILGGGLGNFWERLRKGAATDFLYIKAKNAPVFNIADVFIVIGGILFAYYFMIQHDKMQLMQGRGGDA